MTDIFLCVPELTRFCSFPLGVQSGRIKNSQMTSSSIWNRYHAPFLGRLKRVRTGRYMGGWAARHNNHNQWIQVDLGRLFKVTMISTQGRKIVKQWVTRYTVSYSLDAVHYVSYKQRDRLKVYTRLYVKYFFFFLSRLYYLIDTATWVGMGPLLHFGFIVWLKLGHSWEETGIRSRI